MQKLLEIFFVLSLLTISTSCSKLEGDDPCYNCPTRDSEAQVSQSDVSVPPAGVQTLLLGHYFAIRYLEVVKYKVHIFATRDVNDWMLVKSHEMIKNMIDALSSPSHQDKFKGHQFFIITNRDPIVPNGAPGHRNTGMGNFSIINQDIICRSAVDTIRPDNVPQYRAWDTPVHEFGHSFEILLDPDQGLVKVHEVFNPNHNSAYNNEYFAWAVEKWFNASYAGSYTRDTLDTYVRQYLGQFFREEHSWTPSCDDRP